MTSNGVIIMAGGLGKRMRSTVPKVLHLFHNIPMLIRIIREAKKINPSKILIVVGKYKDIIEKTIIEWENNMKGITFVIQEPANGTGHAIQCCVPDIKKYNLSQVLILNGDNPLIKSETMIKMINQLNDKNKCCIMTTYLDRPYGNGRIILDKNNNIRDFFYKRLMFPIANEFGKIVGFGGRVLDNSNPKYINSPESDFFKKRNILYNLYNVKQNIRSK